MNGTSDLSVEWDSEAGRHARSAVGRRQLPMNIAEKRTAAVMLTRFGMNFASVMLGMKG